ncbi:hypothetical protein HDU98_009981 [Podochytrium sp. JEL0797]|nr:hypothetical protein HDU98_009981 [Podochytrium sp. JEL0797]
MGEEEEPKLSTSDLMSISHWSIFSAGDLILEFKRISTPLLDQVSAVHLTLHCGLETSALAPDFPISAIEGGVECKVSPDHQIERCTGSVASVEVLPFYCGCSNYHRFLFAFENVAFYDLRFGKEDSIRYDEEGRLLADVVFKAEASVYAFETALRKYFDGFCHQLNTSLCLSLESFEVTVVPVPASCTLQRVLSTHYDPSANEISPQTSTAKLHEHDAVTSVVDISDPLFAFQRIEDEMIFSHCFYQMPSRGQLQAFKNSDNNIILLSKDLHNLFDGINAQVPGMLIAFKSRAPDVNLATGRCEIHVYIEFFDTSLAQAFSRRLKKGSQSLSELVWSTTLHVMDVDDFKFCLNWKMERTADQWRDQGRKDLNYIDF